MAEYTLGQVEARFARLIWDNAPVSSGRLVELAGVELGWKKSTTYTVLRRLCQRGIFQNEGGVVEPLVTPEELAARQSREFVEQSFGGSLPRFLAAFSSGKGLTEQEVAQLQQLIDESRR